MFVSPLLNKVSVFEWRFLEETLNFLPFEGEE